MLSKQFIFATAVIAAALSGCARAPAPAPAAASASPGQADNKAWARIDGRRMAGNPALTRQGQSDLSTCRAESAVSPGARMYDLPALEACMQRRGYREISTGPARQG